MVVPGIGNRRSTGRVSLAVFCMGTYSPHMEAWPLGTLLQPCDRLLAGRGRQCTRRALQACARQLVRRQVD